MKEISYGKVVPEENNYQTVDIEDATPDLTPDQEVKLIEDAKQFADDALDLVASWEQGHGHFIYPFIIQAMKSLGDKLMQYEEHHLAQALQVLQGVPHEKKKV